MDRSRFTFGLRRFHQVAMITVAGLCLLVVAGGIVRLTGSGLGCDDWPNCNAERFVDVSSGHTAVEQVNRLLSGLIGVPTLILAVGSFRVRPRRDGLVGPSIGVLVTVLANGVVGGIAVRVDLHPALVQSHFALAMMSIAFALVSVHRSHEKPVRPRVAAGISTGLTRLFWLVGALVAAALATGTVVTGTGPHAGEEDVRRWGFDISGVARIHSVTVLAAVAALLVLAWAIRRSAQLDPRLRHRLESWVSAWMFVAIVQGGIGYLQYFNGVPEVLVGAHIAGATGLWVVTVVLVAAGVSPLPVAGQTHDVAVAGSESRGERGIHTTAAGTA